MSRYISGRYKKTPQSALTSDRYRYLSPGDAEPNLGDTPTAQGSPDLPPGQQYIVVGFLDRPGERFWIPNQGGLIPGSISVFDEGDLVGGLSSTTQLDFQGNAIVAEGIQSPQPGVAVTITVSPPGDNNSVLFKNNDDFDTDTRFTFDSGLLAAGDRITVGTGGTVITTTLGGLVGIGTTIPTQELHLNGDFRITGTIYDSLNQPGNPGDLLVKSELGDLIWIRPEAVISGAGGTIGQIQFHNAAGLVDGADNFYFDYINNRVGIGSTQPTQLLDVLGVSTFSGGVNVDTLTAFENSTFKKNLTVDKKLIVDGLADLDELKVVGIATFDNKIEAKKDLDVDGHTELDNLGVSGIATFSGELQIADTGSLNIIGTSVGVAVTLAGNGGITTTGGDLYVGGDLYIKDDLTFDHLTANTGTFNTSLYVSGIFTATSFADIDDIRITGHTIKSTGTGDNLVLQSDHGNVQINDDVYINSDIESNDKDTGALVVNGGVGIEKNLNVGGAVSFTGPSSGVAATISAAGGITTTGGNLFVGGDLNVKDDLVFTDLSGENMVISGIATINQLEIGQPDQTLIGITSIFDEDNMVSDSDTALATQQSIKAYVDNEIGAIDLDFEGDTGTGAVDLDDQTFKISGTTNEIETSASNQTLTIGLPDNVTVSGNLTVNGNTTLGDDATVDTVSFGSTISSSFIPNAHDTYNIGSDNYRWGTVYATTFDGAFQGTADTADRLTTPRTFTLGEGENDDIVSVGKTFDGSADVGFALTLTNTTVTASDYGSSSKVGTFSVDAKGRLTAAADVDINFAGATVAIAGYAHTAGIATIAGYAHTAGIATHLKGGQAYNIPYQSGADTTQFISNGSDGQLLKYNDNAAPSWISAGDISAGIAQTADNLSGGAAGSIPYQTGPGATAFLGEPNADNYVLTYNNTGDAPEWKELSTFGGVGYALSAIDSGNNVKLRLSDGTTNDDVLITAGSNISIDTVTEGGFTIDAVKGAGVSIASSASDILNVTNGEIGGVDTDADKIVFYDDSETKLTYLTVGTGLTIDDTTINVDSGVGNTYDLSVEQTDSDDDNPAIRLSDGTNNDDITITGGSNITVTRNSATQLTIAAAAGAGIGVAASADDILDVTNGNIAADNANADKIVFYDFSASKLTYLTVGTGLSITDTTITGKLYSQEVGEESGNTGNINLRLKDDNKGTFDDILVTAGSGVTFSSISADGFTIEVDTDSGDIALDKISEGNSKAEIIDTATESKLTVVIDNAEKFSVDSTSSKIHRQDTSNEGGSLVFNRANDDTAAFEIDVYGSSSSDSGRFRIIDATSTTERFEIGPNGEIGLSGANYGSSGQVLTSNGSGSAVTWQTVSGSGGGTGNGTLIDVEVKQFSDNDTPRTEYACTNPIDVDVDATAGIATIGIGTVSNAYGKRYIGPTEPTQDVCDGDIWYDTSTGGGDAAFTSDPVGTIVAWSGTVANIPAGYQLCDGTGVLSVELQAIVGANVPDLRSRFIVGASDVTGEGTWPSVGVGSTGGNSESTLPSHRHIYPGDDHLAFANGKAGWTGGVNNSNTYADTFSMDADSQGSGNGRMWYTTYAGSNDTNTNLPPYYALCYIIKYGASNTTISGVVDKISEGNTEAEVVDSGTDGHFKVTTEGTERLRIDHNGNVGIGTTIPTATLDVNGKGRFRNYNGISTDSAIVIESTYLNSYDLTGNGSVSGLDRSRWWQGKFPDAASIENSVKTAGIFFGDGDIGRQVNIEIGFSETQYSGSFALFTRNSAHQNYADNFISGSPTAGIRVGYSTADATNSGLIVSRVGLDGAYGQGKTILHIKPNGDNLLFDGGNVGIGFDASAYSSEQPTAKLHVKGTVAIGSSLYDSNGNLGSEGQVLSSLPGIGVSWTDQTGGSGGSGGGDAIVLQTAKTATGSSVEFTDIPADAYEITLMFNGVSLNGSNSISVELGTSSSYITQGYTATSQTEDGSNESNDTNAFTIYSLNNYLHHGKFDINKFSDTSYTFEGQSRTLDNGGVQAYGCLNGISETITRLRIKPSGTNNFDAGSINISYKTPGSANNEGTDAGQGFFENDTTLNSSKTLPANKNVGIFGPYTIGNNVTLTVPAGTTFTVV